MVVLIGWETRATVCRTKAQRAPPGRDRKDSKGLGVPTAVLKFYRPVSFPLGRLIPLTGVRLNTQALKAGTVSDLLTEHLSPPRHWVTWFT